jgi:hypothetical protein
LEITSLLEYEFGHMPSAKELSDALGGFPSVWGRILKGQREPAGEYRARLKRLEERGINNVKLELNAAKISSKYGWEHDEDKLIPKTINIFSDIERFCAERVVRKDVAWKEMDELELKYGEGAFLLHSPQYLYHSAQREGWFSNPRDCFDEETLQREFINSLL